MLLLFVFMALAGKLLWFLFVCLFVCLLLLFFFFFCLFLPPDSLSHNVSCSFCQVQRGSVPLRLLVAEGDWWRRVSQQFELYRQRVQSRG
jgi:hypothetical protein